MDMKAAIALALAGAALVVVIISLATDYWVELAGLVRRKQNIWLIFNFSVFLLIDMDGYSQLSRKHSSLLSVLLNHLLHAFEREKWTISLSYNYHCTFERKEI